MERKAFNAGDVIFREGDPSDFAFMIVTGGVEVCLTNGRKIVLKPGDVFGEMGLVDQRPRSATVRSTEYTVCAAYTEKELLTSIREAPDEAMALISALIARLREANRS